MNSTTQKTSRHQGYYHYATQYGKQLGAILPMMEEWTSDKVVARKQAQAMSNSTGWPVVVFWCGLVDGVLTRSFRVMPKEEK